MKSFFVTVAVLALLLAGMPLASPVYGQEKAGPGESIKLPAPLHDGQVSVEKALTERRSIREYSAEPLSLVQVGQIVWAAQGITEARRGLRTAPSARARYFLHLYVVPGNVTGLSPGLYRYEPKGHELIPVARGDKKADLFGAAGQNPIKAAPMALVLTGLKDKASNPGWMYVEAGHASQNVYLQALSLKLGTVAMAGFRPDEVRKALGLPENEEPIYIMPVGRR